MATNGTAGTSAGGGTGSRARLSHSVGPDLTLESSSACCERVVGNVFVDMNCLGVLSQVIKTGESSSAVALKRPLAGVFSVRCQQEQEAVQRLAYLICLARCSLLVKERVQGG